MPVIRFQTNVPVEMRLRYLEGKAVESQFGGMQHMFTAEEGTFYVSEAVGEILADQLRELRVRAGDPVEIVKAEVSRGNGRKGIQWTVSQVGYYPGEQADGTLAVPKAPEAAKPSELEEKLAQSLQMVQARKDAEKAAQAAPAGQPKWAQALSMQTRHLVDVYAELVNYASARHGNAVRSDDIRALMTTAFINLSKGGSNSNAA